MDQNNQVLMVTHRSILVPLLADTQAKPRDRSSHAQQPNQAESATRKIRPSYNKNEQGQKINPPSSSQPDCLIYNILELQSLSTIDMGQILKITLLLLPLLFPVHTCVHVCVIDTCSIMLGKPYQYQLHQ